MLLKQCISAGFTSDLPASHPQLDSAGLKWAYYVLAAGSQLGTISSAKYSCVSAASAIRPLSGALSTL